MTSAETREGELPNASRNGTAPAGSEPEELDGLRISLRTYRRVVFVALLLLCAIVVTGAAVRLTGSGLGCSSWPNCEPGEFIEIGSPNQAIEQINRLFTGAVSLGVAAAVLGATRLHRRRRDLLWLSLGLVAGVIGQIVLGGITVLVDLHPVAVAGHFLLSMILVSTATVLLWRSGIDPDTEAPPEPPARADPQALARPYSESRIRALSWAVEASCAAVLAVTGPLVTGSGPHAGDLDAPRFDVAITDAARIHSISAWVFCALVVGLLILLARTGTDRLTTTAGTILLAVIVAQGGIGYLQYERGIPAGLVLAHILGATCIAVAATWFQCELVGGHLRHRSDRP